MAGETIPITLATQLVFSEPQPPSKYDTELMVICLTTLVVVIFALVLMWLHSLDTE